MSKLLKEAQIRRMMKLASIGTLSENFVTNLEEDEMEEGMGGVYGRDEEAHMMEEEEMDLEDDEAPPQMDDDEGMGADKEEVAMDIITAIADKLSDEFDLDIDVSADAEPADMDDMGDEPMDDMEDMGDEPMDDMEAEAEEDEVLEGVDVVEEEELVAEVLKRVTARLRTALKESKKVTK
jgi:hypothetical protein